MSSSFNMMCMCVGLEFIFLLHGSQVKLLMFSSWTENRCEIVNVNHHEIWIENHCECVYMMIDRYPMESLCVGVVKMIGNVTCQVVIVCLTHDKKRSIKILEIKIDFKAYCNLPARWSARIVTNIFAYSNVRNFTLFKCQK